MKLAQTSVNGVPFGYDPAMAGAGGCAHGFSCLLYTSPSPRD